jgi:hypothetical protein
MKLAHRPVAAAALFLATIALSACVWTEECAHPFPRTLTVRADQACPSARDVQARVVPELATTGVTIDSEALTQVAVRARGVCWYRATDADLANPCPWETRASQLANAMRPEAKPDDFSDRLSIGDRLGCDAHGPLYGKVILAADTDPSTGLPTTPVDCPDMVTPDPSLTDDVTSVTTFVGSDEYPARVSCEYQTTAHDWCGWDQLTH